MKEQANGYASFLLRLWECQVEQQTVWRASLESTQTGQRINFASLDELVAFLAQEYRKEPNAGEPARTPPP